MSLGTGPPKYISTNEKKIKKKIQEKHLNSFFLIKRLQVLTLSPATNQQLEQNE